MKPNVDLSNFHKGKDQKIEFELSEEYLEKLEALANDLRITKEELVVKLLKKGIESIPGLLEKAKRNLFKKDIDANTN